MAIVPTSLIAFALLLSFLPGIAFFTGFFVNEKMSRDVVSFSSPPVFSGLLIVSVIVQTLLLVAFVAPTCASSTDASPICSFTLSGTPTSPLDVSVGQVVSFNITLLLASAFMFALGAIYITKCAAKPSLFVFAKSWTRQYLFFDGYCLAHVMTELPNVSGPVIYRGILDDLYLKADGTISTIHLTEAETVTMTQFRNGRLGITHVHSTSGLSENDLVLHGSQIKNLALKNLLQFSTSKSDQLILRRAYFALWIVFVLFAVMLQL